MNAIGSKKMGWIVAALMASGLAVVGVAAAHEGGDKSGKSNKEAHRQEMLTKYDKNKDGKLDDAERKTMFDEHVADRFKAMDKDGDGKLSFDEFKAGAAEMHGHHGHHGGRDHENKKDQ